MEKNNQEPVPQLNLEQALWQVNEGVMLQFMPDGFKLLKYVESRVNHTRLMRTGETVHPYTTPYREPVLEKEASTLDELFDSNDIDGHHDGQLVTEIDTEEFQDWVKSLIYPEDIRLAAVESLDNNQNSDDEKTEYPSIILRNEFTGQEKAIELDLASLVANGDVEVEWTDYQKSYPNDFQVCEKRLKFNVADYLSRSIAEIGVDMNNAVKTSGAYVGKVESERSNVIGRLAYWQKRNGVVKRGFGPGQENMTAADVIAIGQTKLTNAYAWPRGYEAQCLTEVWSLRPLPPIADVLENLKTTISDAGYTLGFTQSVTATGETGPSFFVLDVDGNVVVQLSSDYRIRESLEKATVKLHSLRA